ncbi:MAG: mechanosensitive ion channel domain-containing protein [Sedimenticola sp.]
MDKIRKLVEADTTMGSEAKQKALALVSQVSNWLEESDKINSEVRRLTQLLKNAPERIEQAKRELALPLENIVPLKQLGKPPRLEELEPLIHQEELIISQDRDALMDQESELALLLVGTQGMGNDIAALSKAIGEIDTDIEKADRSSSDTMEQARLLALEARNRLRQTELNVIRIRYDNLGLFTQLAQAERDLLLARITLRAKRLDELRRNAQQLREEQAQSVRQQARDLAARGRDLPPLLQQLLGEVAELQQELEALILKETTISGELKETQKSLEQVGSIFELTRHRVEVVGSNEAIGKMLRKRQEILPTARSYRRKATSRTEEITRVTGRQIEIEERLRDHQFEWQQLRLELLPQAPASKEERQLQNTIDSLMGDLRDALNRLQAGYGRYISQLTALEQAQRQLVSVSREFTQYIDEQLLWIPSGGVEGLRLPALVQATGWIINPLQWRDAVSDIWELFKLRPGASLFLLLAILTLIKLHKIAVQRIGDIAHLTLKIRTDSFLHTLKALGYSILVVGPLPLLLVGGGVLLQTLPAPALFTMAVANGMIKGGTILGGLLFLRYISLKDGLGERHLRWPRPVLDTLVRELKWLTPVAAGLSLLLAMTSSNRLPPAAHHLGQLVFLMLMVAASLFVYRLLRSEGESARYLQGKGGMLAQTHFLWFPFATLLPLGLALASMAGYYHTATQFMLRAELTFWFFLGLFLFKELLLRSLYITERRLRLEEALKRREELRAQREASEEEAAPTPLEIPEFDYENLGEQAKRLLRAGYLLGAVVGTWLIWSALLPALGFLDTTQLPLQTERIIDGVSKEVAVTLGDLVMGFIIALVTVLAAKNLPGVLEITLLQRLPLDAGARYAITTLAQYLIVGFGIFAAFSSLGISWSSIQWLVAALGVGLGFGLQEIVANFISGIIMLFERPVRVGDVVTIDNTTGTVTRIRIRATTIKNWDKQELLVPNKEFITGRLINWTLSDKLNRVIIPVGIAYGSDVDRAMELMLEAAHENQEVVDDPQAFCTFESFGDNALGLTLRAYLDSIDNRINTITALHKAINEKFNDAGIVIAFPQRDLHLDTSGPLEVRISNASSTTEGGG